MSDLTDRLDELDRMAESLPQLPPADQAKMIEQIRNEMEAIRLGLSINTEIVQAARADSEKIAAVILGYWFIIGTALALAHLILG